MGSVAAAAERGGVLRRMVTRIMTRIGRAGGPDFDAIGPLIPAGDAEPTAMNEPVRGTDSDRRLGSDDSDRRVGARRVPRSSSGPGP